MSRRNNAVMNGRLIPADTRTEVRGFNNRPVKLAYYGSGRHFFNAFTILRCATCKFEVCLEAHHDHKGRRLYKWKDGKSWKKWSKRPVKCPAGHTTWHYVRTEVLLSPPVESFRRTNTR